MKPFCKKSAGNSAANTAENSPGNIFSQINPQETCKYAKKKLFHY
jgi:hypothetical protein